jgi:hypothetical protein
MRKLVLIFVVIVFSLGSVLAVSSTLGDSYMRKETIIGELSNNIIDIDKGNARVLKDGHIDIGFNGDIVVLNGRYFIWLNGIQNAGSYTLRITDIIAYDDGFPSVVDFTKSFTITEDESNYDVSPGAIFANDDFSIASTLYDDFAEIIQIDYPTQRDETLLPGNNVINIDIGDFVGNKFVMLNIGKYSVPAYLVGEDYICGDGDLDNVEVCDGSNLDGKTCIMKGYDFGNLSCSNSCLSFVETSCEYEPESVCDIEHLGLCKTQGTCIDSGGYWYNSKCNLKQKVGCSSNNLNLCSTIGTCLDSGGYWYGEFCNVEQVPSCNINNLELCLDESSCRNRSGFWYDETCNQYEKGSICDALHVRLCVTAGTCLDARGYWYNGKCNKEQKPECDLNNLELCITEGTCLDARGYWHDNECNKNEKGKISVWTYHPPRFKFFPRIMRKTLLLSERPERYPFSITNVGEGRIENLRIGYNTRNYVVTPNLESIILELNETAYFNLTLREPTEKIRGAIVGFSENVSEYFLFEIDFTENQSEVRSKFTINSSSDDPGYYCSELSGAGCAEEEFCSGETASSIDENVCCISGLCEKVDGEKSYAWIGYLVAAIVILILLIVYVKFKKTKTKKGPAQRFASAENKLPTMHPSPQAE